MNGSWTQPDIRDEVIDYVRTWSDKTELHANTLVGWIGIPRSKYYHWKERYGQVNEHNAWVPRDHWLEDWEKQAIIAYHYEHPLDGYRLLTYMMMDADIVAVSPASTYRVLKTAGLLGKWNSKPSSKGTGFVQPIGPHEHWHIDVSYINICGTFYYLCSILDGSSRLIVHHEIREQMKESDVETILQRAKEKHPEARPRIISDNGPQFIARDFKEFIRISVEHYNTRRLHSAIGYVTPQDKLLGREKEIFAARDRKLEAARQQRQAKRLGQTLEKSENTPASEKALDCNAKKSKSSTSGQTEAGSAGEQPAEG